MKLRQRFYSFPELLGHSDYAYIAAKQQIRNKDELKRALLETVNKTDLKKKYRDFEHLLFNKVNAERILRFEEFVKKL